MSVSKDVDFEQHIGPGANIMVAQIKRLKEEL